MAQGVPDLAITGGRVLREVSDVGVMAERATVLVAGGEILALGPPSSPLPPEGICERLDASGGLVLPGLVNAHGHAAMTLFRGYADDLPLERWLMEKIFPAEACYLTPDTVYWGTLLACLEMVGSGTTAFADGYFFEDAVCEAVSGSGMRALLAQGVLDFPVPGVPDAKDTLRVATEFVGRWKGVSPRIVPGIFCHSPVTCSRKTLVAAQGVCRTAGVPLQIHVSETLEEVRRLLADQGKRPISYLEDMDLLGPDLVLAHGIHLEDAEVALLQGHDVLCVHCPASAMKLGSGTARVGDMLRRGVSVALGTDGCASNNTLDLFREMHTARVLSRIFGEATRGLSQEEVLTMATASGKRLFGPNNRLGALEPGNRADVIVLDLGSPHLHPLSGPWSRVLSRAGGADVRHTVVDGRVLMKDRVFLTMDAERILARVGEIRKRLGRAA